jgi:hypothetical protein
MIEATKKITCVEFLDLIDFVKPTTLVQPGQSIAVAQDQRVNYYRTELIAAAVIAQASPGGLYGRIHSRVRVHP